MSNKENKVQFNLKNVHYAILTPGDTPTWSTPGEGSRCRDTDSGSER